MVDEPTSVEPRRDDVTALHPSWMARRNGPHSARRHLAPAPSHAELSHAADRRVNVRPVSRTKVTPAPVGEAVLARDRLLDWLHRHVHRRIVTVVAETGYGKTTLLADFTRRTSVRCLWYRLDGSDRDWITFVHYIVAAAREAVPSFGGATLALFREEPPGPTLELVVSTLLAELAELSDQTTVLVLDDWQVVDEEPSIRSVMTRLIAGAPDRMSFVVLSRRPPRLLLGRLAAQGEAAELTRDDLRFSPDETERLLRDSVHAPLEPEVVAQIEAKTEGWAASLQMLRSSLRGRSPADVRAFVRALSGAEGQLYDYLAEEVMADLPLDVQRFLTLTSILDTVSPHLAAAIYAAEPAPPSAELIESWCRSASESGLMARRAALATGRRYHPLLRQFLQRRLDQLVSASELRGMHLRVGRAAEPSDWLVACHHYAKAEARADATRVLSANAADALGTGVWRDAAELSREVGASDEDPRIAVIQARDEVYGGRFSAALRKVERFDLGELDGPTRGLVVQARAHARAWAGELQDDTLRDVAGLVDDETVPSPHREIARAFMLGLASCRDGRLDDAENKLRDLADSQEQAGQWFHAAISCHNRLFMLLSRGDYAAAVDAGHRSIALFHRVPDSPEEVYGVHFGLARAYAELGDFALAQENLELAFAATSIGGIEQWFEGPSLLVPLGETERARELLARARGSNTGRLLGNPFAEMMAQAVLALAAGSPSSALSAMGPSFDAWPTATVSSWLAWIHLRAVLALSVGDGSDADRWVETGAHLVERQNSGLYRGRFRLLAALASRSLTSIGYAIQTASEMDLLASAEAIIPLLDIIEPVPPALQQSLAGRPKRWLPLLRRAIQDPSHASAIRAAELLDEYGELSDVRALRALAKSSIRGLKGSSIGRSLARRRSPHLLIEDLGRSGLQVGARRVEVSSMRRKAASVLCYLLTRKSLLATKEQLLDVLWPELDPEAAANSLNQTLYFLRRDIDPSYDDDYSPQYIRLESDLLWLEPELVTARSNRFHLAATSALASRDRLIEAGPEALGLYAGRFAPEFEYEDWASAWRDLLHGQFLHLGESLSSTYIHLGRLVEAADIAVRCLAVEPIAEQVERELIWVYGTLGVRSAAAEQYSHYAAVQRNEFGVEPPSLEEIISSPLGIPAY